MSCNNLNFVAPLSFRCIHVPHPNKKKKKCPPPHMQKKRKPFWKSLGQKLNLKFPQKSVIPSKILCLRCRLKLPHAFHNWWLPWPNPLTRCLLLLLLLLQLPPTGRATRQPATAAAAPKQNPLPQPNPLLLPHKKKTTRSPKRKKQSKPRWFTFHRRWLTPSTSTATTTKPNQMACPNATKPKTTPRFTLCCPQRHHHLRQWSRPQKQQRMRMHNVPFICTWTMWRIHFNWCSLALLY